MIMNIPELRKARVRWANTGGSLVEFDAIASILNVAKTHSAAENAIKSTPFYAIRKTPNLDERDVMAKVGNSQMLSYRLIEAQFTSSKYAEVHILP